MALDETKPVEQEIRRPDQIQGLEPPFSPHTFFLLEVSIKVFATGIIAVFGLITNIINIIVFYRQGIFSNSSMVAFIALATSDFCCCFLSLWGSICSLFYHFIDTSTWKWEVFGFMIFTSMRPLNMCTQITCWNTAFMAFERMISVTFPFKVKSIFTPRRSLVAMTCIFIINVTLYTPSLLVESAIWEINSENNVTYIGWQPSNLVTQIFWPNVHTYLNPVTLRFSAIFIVVFCNVVIFWKVKLSHKFRKKSASIDNKTSQSATINEPSSSELEGSSTKNKHGNEMSSKEIKLLRIITTVSVVFTICYMCHIINNIRFVLITRFNVGHHWYLEFIFLNISMFFQILNSSTNIIIYYTLSSRFRNELRLCFKLKKTPKF